jgi:hypothetical protein
VLGSGGTGVSGYSENGVGVYGDLNSPSSVGATVSLASGVWADSADTSSSGKTAALLATADDQYAGYFVNASDTGTLYVENDAGNSLTNLVFATNSNFSGANRECTIDVQGNLGCAGALKEFQTVAAGARNVETYSVQSAENWLEDFGSGQLSQGAARVELEPDFAQTVNTGVEYHVFLTPKGDCKGLYVTNETPGGFEVRELGGGKSSVAFDYRIVAKRTGYENVRLLDVTDRLKQQAEERERIRHSANARPQAGPIAPMQPRLGQPGTRIPQMRIPAMPVQPAKPTVKTLPAKVAELK